jgi:hypothetical protein
MYELFMFADRRSAPAFWLGTLAVVIGVLLHLPMFVMARSMHYRLAGMANRRCTSESPRQRMRR